MTLIPDAWYEDFDGNRVYFREVKYGLAVLESPDHQIMVPLRELPKLLIRRIETPEPPEGDG